MSAAVVPHADPGTVDEVSLVFILADALASALESLEQEGCDKAGHKDVMTEGAAALQLFQAWCDEGPDDVPDQVEQLLQGRPS